MPDQGRCEKCGVPLAEEDFVPCDLDADECPLLRSFDRALDRAVKADSERRRD